MNYRGFGDEKFGRSPENIKEHSSDWVGRQKNNALLCIQILSIIFLLYIYIMHIIPQHQLHSIGTISCAVQCIYITIGLRIHIMLTTFLCDVTATFLHDVTATFLSVTDTYIRTYIHTYAHHENRSRIRKLATLAIIVSIII